MLPIRDENPTFRTSVVTGALIAVNVGVWVFVQGLGLAEPLLNSVCRYGLIPGELLGTLRPGTRIMLSRGVACVITEERNFWTLFSHMFLHGGWLHLIGNMWFLGIFGDNVEEALGHFRYLIFYLLCGLTAALAQMASDPRSGVPMVGASGAIGGVMGAYAVLYPKAPVHLMVLFGFYPIRYVVPAFTMLGYWFLLQFLGGVLSVGPASGGVAFWAHVGGFLCGVVLGPLMCRADRVRDCRRRRGRVRRLVAPAQHWREVVFEEEW